MSDTNGNKKFKPRESGENEVPIKIIKSEDDNIPDPKDEEDYFTDMEDVKSFTFMDKRFNADIVLGVAIFLLLLLLWGASGYGQETPAERIVKIQEAITMEQQANIFLADVELTALSIKRDKQIAELASTSGEIAIYEHCKMLNQTSNLPVDCSSITLTTKQRLGWGVNTNGFSQEYQPLNNTTPHTRAEELLGKYSTTRGTIKIWEAFEKQYGIKLEVAIAIAKADSSLGDELKTKNNIGNVGNTDSGDTVAFNTIESGIEAIFKTLNNQYLGDIYTVGYLSEGGRRVIGAESCSVSGVYCYATSEENWNINTINTLKLIYNDPSIDESFLIRTN